MESLPRRRWAVGVVGAAVLLLWLLPHPRPDPTGPAEPAVARMVQDVSARWPAPPPEPGVRALDVTLPRERTGLTSAECGTNRPVSLVQLYGTMVARGGDAGEAMTAGMLWGRSPPPAAVRRALRTAGLTPSRLGAWVAPIDPWAGYAGLVAERGWALRDWQEASDPVARRRSPVRTEAARPLSEALADSDDPDLRAAGILSLVEESDPVPVSVLHRALLDPTLPDVVHLGAAQKTCGADARLDAAGRQQLRQRVLAATNGEWAVTGSLVGLRSAWVAGDIDEVQDWLALLEQQRERCQRYGWHVGAATDPRLPTSFEGLPPHYAPGGFDVEAVRIADQLGMEVRVDCSHPPCSATYVTPDPAGRSRPLRSAVEAAWPGAAVVNWGTPDADGWTLAALPAGTVAPDVLAELAELAEPDQHYACVDDAKLRSLRAEVSAEPPADWVEALKRGVFACHRSVGVGTVRSTRGVWFDGWRFDPSDRFLACVGDHVDLGPDDGTPVDLTVTVQ